ncbi:hypothetical protein VNO80_17032 [Phaseolus coccineus]|uniref:Uncharacterized protein n=1 Tax=Phaseolus coccineus TaxID=3886 RepID=A0AAN9MNL7_PHACN
MLASKEKMAPDIDISHKAVVFTAKKNVGKGQSEQVDGKEGSSLRLHFGNFISGSEKVCDFSKGNKQKKLMFPHLHSNSFPRNFLFSISLFGIRLLILTLSFVCVMTMITV